MGGLASAGLRAAVAAQAGRRLPALPARQLAGRAGRLAGTVYQEVALIHRSDRPCTLSDGPTAVTGIRVTGCAAMLTRAASGVGLAG